MEEKILHKPGKCSYCGDAPINHTLAYVTGVLGIFFDSFFSRALGWVPNFVIRAVDTLLEKFLHALVVLKIIKLSSNSEKATTLRSRVIWNEASVRGIPME